MRILSLVTNADSKFYRQQVAGLRDRGHTVDTLAVPRAEYENGTASENRSLSTYLRYYARVLGTTIEDYDIVHANYGLTAPPAVLQPAIPVLLTLWGSDLMGEYRWMSRICSRLADDVVVMSEEMADLLDRECHVVPHGIDLERFRPVPQPTVRDELGWDEDAHHVLFPYGPSRGVKDYPRAERIVELVRRTLDERVELQTMTGIPHELVPHHMNAADAMILTSKREGSPNTVKEALACNLPVIATDVGDVAERLDGVSYSTVASDDDALANALRTAVRAGERSNGRTLVSEIGQERQLDRIEELLRSVAFREVSAS